MKIAQIKEEQMTDKPECAHYNITHIPVGVGGGKMKDTWQCGGCGQYFVPVKGMEGQMTDKREIFKDEKEVEQFYADNSHIINISIMDFKSCMKSGGYIRKNPVEKWEEYYQSSSVLSPGECLAAKAIQYLLNKEWEKKRNENSTE